MVALKWIISAAVATSSVTAGAFDSLTSPGALRRDALSILKRENMSEGSPSYNCHDNCGQAILETQNCGSVCDDTTFLTDYENCLQCAGPDNEDIWKYYGSELNTTAAECGLSTTPKSGTQDSVGVATAASNSTAACEAAESSSASASSTATASGSASSASGTSASSASSSNAGPTAMANMAAYGAVAIGGLYAIGF